MARGRARNGPVCSPDPPAGATPARSVTVGDIMTPEAITVRRDTSIHEAAQLMAVHGVSGLPVVDEAGRLIGMVSDGDLVLRSRPRLRRPWWHRFLSDGEALAREFQRAFGVTVGAVMSAPVLSARPDLPVALAAVLLDRHHVRRLPVVDGEGTVVGVVSRADFVRALARGGAGVNPWPDVLLLQSLRVRLARDHPRSAPHIEIGARDGVVSLRGAVASSAERAAVEAMARTLPGCWDVDNGIVLGAESPRAAGPQRDDTGR
jgi:CBS domain-containing protein